MTERASITQATIARAIKAARKVDPGAIVEVVVDGLTVRLIPPAGQPMPPADPFDLVDMRRE